MKTFNNGMLRGIGSVVSGMTLIASAAVLLTAAPASAATSCTGTLIDSAPTTDVDNGAFEAFTWIKVGSKLGEVDITGHCG